MVWATTLTLLSDRKELRKETVRSVVGGNCFCRRFCVCVCFIFASDSRRRVLVGVVLESTHTHTCMLPELLWGRDDVATFLLLVVVVGGERARDSRPRQYSRSAPSTAVRMDQCSIVGRSAQHTCARSFAARSWSVFTLLDACLPVELSAHPCPLR